MRATPELALGALLLLFSAGCHRAQPLVRSTSMVATVAISNPATGEPAYVGRWASTRQACADRPWVLTRGELRTGNGLACTLVKMAPGSAGYGGDVDCGPQGARKAGYMTLTLTGQGPRRGLTLLGGPFDLPVTLEYCPVADNAVTPMGADRRPPA